MLRETAQAMLQRGPGARGLLEWIEVSGCGHAPALNVPSHFEWVLQHLRRADLQPRAMG